MLKHLKKSTQVKRHRNIGNGGWGLKKRRWRRYIEYHLYGIVVLYIDNSKFFHNHHLGVPCGVQTLPTIFFRTSWHLEDCDAICICCCRISMEYELVFTNKWRHLHFYFEITFYFCIRYILDITNIKIFFAESSRITNS